MLLPNAVRSQTRAPFVRCANCWTSVEVGTVTTQRVRRQTSITQAAKLLHRIESSSQAFSVCRHECNKKWTVAGSTIKNQMREHLPWTEFCRIRNCCCFDQLDDKSTKLATKLIQDPRQKTVNSSCILNLLVLAIKWTLVPSQVDFVTKSYFKDPVQTVFPAGRGRGCDSCCF